MRPIMIVGTGSDVGKSLVVTGICRWLVRQGHSPAPFKAQNMSLNSYATPEGLEIGRAQAAQAEACRIPCQTTMNPILLKPSSTSTSQVVLHGKPIGQQHAKDYFLGNNKERLFDEAKQAFHKLSSQYSPIVMEGAGSISELNLKHRDITNMRMAQAANACTYLVADIDKGGVFGSVYGTIALLDEWEKKLLKGIIINKFRGDRSLFEAGKKKMEEITGYPVLGILPHNDTTYLEEEDSVALAQKQTEWKAGKHNIAVIRLRYISNYTDFNALGMQEHINLYYTRNPDEIAKADTIIIPGTKNTMADMQALVDDQLDVLIKGLYPHKQVVGICGGYQMMGRRIYDPHHVEGTRDAIDGLGIFDLETSLLPTKETTQRSFRYKDYAGECNGYEIHMGKTIAHGGQHLNLVGGEPEGYHDGKRAWGTYMHGIFDNAAVVGDLVPSQQKGIDYQAMKENGFEMLADMVGEHLDMDTILNDIGATC